jgi:lysozyme
MREVNQAGIDLIKSFEGIADGNPKTVNLDPYIDAVGIYTIGFGHAIKYGNGFLTTKIPNAGMIAHDLYPNGITLDEANELLRVDIKIHSIPVENLVKVPVTDNQFAALVSFAFNLGVNSLRNSTLLKKINKGDYSGASQEFGKWSKAGGKTLKGLVRRRAAESLLFNS